MASSTKPSIAFIGLGAMGFGMATHLVTAGYNVTGYDLWEPSLQKFVAAGGISSTTPREAANGKPILVFMVATGAQANAALFDKENGALIDLPRNATIIHCSTAAPEHVPEMRKLLDEQGRQDVELVDAPVSGGTIRAANGTLTILASGPESSLSSGKQVLDEMAGGNLYVIPGGLGAGTKVKMVHQVLAGIHITMASEAMGFAAALGLNTKETLEYLSQSSGASWMLANRGPRILEVEPVVASALNIITKDVGIVTVAGRKEKFPLFLSSATEQVLATGVRSNLGTIDDSQLVRVYLPTVPDLVAKQAASTQGITDADSKLKLKLVESVLAGVHMASAAEAMSFGAKVGLDTPTLFQIIKGAAGASAMFITRVPLLLSGEWEAKSGGLTIGNHMEQLKTAIDEAAKIKYPLHLAATALQLFELAALRGLEDDPDVSLVRLWDSSVKVFFERSSI